MKYRWHSQKYCYTHASGFTCILIKTKRGEVERGKGKKKTKVKRRTEKKSMYLYCL